ncbi:ferredoxin [Pseudoflavonifractor sp. AF19-9AC]|uniref:ferredoxin n=1 Tax=Pseudoflavonifractor sp. AF19-9AC TaxID=2292244 RepID=UPI000E4B9DD6|nr:ferredoxin [Pseudoflavonifractor sp. AF19-9AC]RHR11258.1 ferredoxin [Pseudoflavonifractor sp. AF19-9AC]
MTIHVNESCVGCGLCVSMCPGVFTMTDEGVAAARDEIFPEQEAQAREAAESCPANAIEVTL